MQQHISKCLINRRLLISFTDNKTNAITPTYMLFLLNISVKMTYQDHTMIAAFSALMLLVGRQEGHPPVKNWVVGCCGG